MKRVMKLLSKDTQIVNANLLNMPQTLGWSHCEATDSKQHAEGSAHTQGLSRGVCGAMVLTDSTD